MNKKIYIIKPYNKYIQPAPQEKIISLFIVNQIWYCISETSLEWGQPQVARPLLEQDDYGYRIYNTYEEAQEFVHMLKQISR